MPSAYEPRLARVAAMIADPTRSRMLAYLLAGHYASAGELARTASITASTASEHLAKLQQCGLVTCEARGRHRYFKLADAEVAHALEALALLAERTTHERSWTSPARQRLCYARCCYGHLAGVLGVSLLDSLLHHDRLRPEGNAYELTDAGVTWLHSIGLVPRRPRRDHRLAYPCVDWSQRRDHLAGSLAVELLDHFLAKDWLVRADRGVRGRTDAAGSHRALRVTPTGDRFLLPFLTG